MMEYADIARRATELNQAEDEARAVIERHAKHLNESAATAEIGHLVDVIRTINDDLQGLRSARKAREDFAAEILGQEN